MERIIYKYSLSIKDCWTLNGFYTATIIGYIYVVTGWWHKPYFTTKVFVPYLKSPTFDGEYATNKMLRAYSVEVRAKLEEIIDKKSRLLRRLSKRK